MNTKPEGLELINFESIKFNKEFNVYSSCKQKAFETIKPQQIERIIALEKEYKSKLLMAIKGDKLYFGFYDNKNYFEIGQYHSYDNVKAAVLNEINFVKKILRILD